jgi:exodeoxyribonuclease VII small subunit
LAHYERGIKLLRECHELLSQAERKIEVLAGFDSQGNPVTAPLAEAEAETEKMAEPTRRRMHRPGAAGRREKPRDDIPF